MNMPSKIINGLSHLELNDVLDRVGLQRKTSFVSKLLPAIGLVVGGIGIGMLLAPRAGRDTRKGLVKGAKELAETASEIRENSMHIFAADEVAGNGHVKKSSTR